MNKEELEKVEQLIEQKDSEQLKDLLAGLHPADIAELCNELDAEEARFIYLLLDNETAADVLIEMDEDLSLIHISEPTRLRNKPETLSIC